MRTDFSPKLFRNPLAVLGRAQALLGLGQAIFSGRKKAEKALNQQIDQAPKTTANKSILDYYNNALSRYNVDPASTAMYKRNMQSINQGVASGVAGLQDRRSALGGISSLLRAKNDATLNTNVAAENQRDQRFNQLGAATGMKANEDQRVFEQNEMLPYDLRLQLKAQKLQGANQRTNAGMQNLFGGLGTLGSSGIFDKKQ